MCAVRGARECSCQAVNHRDELGGEQGINKSQGRMGIMGREAIVMNLELVIRFDARARTRVHAVRGGALAGRSFGRCPCCGTMSAPSGRHCYFLPRRHAFYYAAFAADSSSIPRSVSHRSAGMHIASFSAPTAPAKTLS